MILCYSCVRSTTLAWYGIIPYTTVLAAVRLPHTTGRHATAHGGPPSGLSSAAGQWEMDSIFFISKTYCTKDRLPYLLTRKHLGTEIATPLMVGTEA